MTSGADAAVVDRREMVKVVIELPSADGKWPPVASERLWAFVLEGDLVELNSIPFFAMGYSCGDVVRIFPNEQDELIVGDVVTPSDNCTIRIIPREEGDRHEIRTAIMDEFTALGVDSEAVSQFNIVALHVPPSADLPAVSQTVLRGSNDGRWHFDGGVLTGELKAALNEDR